jgi:hypothetical protein
MPIIVGENKSPGTPYHLKKIRCPGHWMINCKEDIYLREPIEALKGCKDFVYLKDQRIDIRKTRIVRDKWGRKQIDWKKMYELKRKGKVINPYVSASWAIEHVWDPLSFICKTCPKWCKEGKGTISELSIRRLHG